MSIQPLNQNAGLSALSSFHSGGYNIQMLQFNELDVSSPLLLSELDSQNMTVHCGCLYIHKDPRAFDYYLISVRCVQLQCYVKQKPVVL